MLSRAEARAFYDCFGKRQDLQRFYEDPAVDVLLAHSGFANARAVVEFGCGTGRLAARLLREQLPADATYTGFDLSSTMVDLARARLRPWANRATVECSDGGPDLPLPAGSCDRFLSTYVLDLLSFEDIGAVLVEAHRLLVPGGRLCLGSLTFGETAGSRTVLLLWSVAHRLRPALVGGCRPLRLADHLAAGFQIEHRQVVCPFAICSEVVVAERAAATPARSG